MNPLVCGTRTIPEHPGLYDAFIEEPLDKEDPRLIPTCPEQGYATYPPNATKNKYNVFYLLGRLSKYISDNYRLGRWN